MKELLKTPTTMIQANPLTTSEIENIQKEYEALMKRNEEILEWMKRVGLRK